MVETSTATGKARRALGTILSVALVASVLGGCASDTLDRPSPTASPATSNYPPGIPAEALIGRWGVGAFHREKDRYRTEIIAGQQCSHPYTIGKGPTGGVIMHLADQKEPSELRVKGAPGGRTFIGPEGPPAIDDDREVISLTKEGIMTIRFVDPTNAKRFGTMVYARCPGR